MSTKEIGVSFGSFHTYRNGGFVLTEDSIGYPKVIEQNSDLKDALEPFAVEYGHRPLSFTLYPENDTDLNSKYQALSDAVSGKLLDIQRDIEPGMTYHGRCTLDEWTSVKVNGFVTVTVDALPFKTGERVIQTVAPGSTITVAGAFVTPAVLRITPNGSISTLTLTGCARNLITGAASAITVKNLRSGNVVVIDGEKKTVKEGSLNKYAECEMWEFPTLKPGNNVINANSSSLTLVVEYEPRYI